MAYAPFSTDTFPVQADRIRRITRESVSLTFRLSPAASSMAKSSMTMFLQFVIFKPSAPDCCPLKERTVLSIPFPQIVKCDFPSILKDWESKKWPAGNSIT